MPVDISGAGTITGLQSEGISSQPVFPGNVIQVVQGTSNTRDTTTSTSFVSSSVNVSITPSDASNKIYVTSSIHGIVGADGTTDERLITTLYRDSINLGGGNEGGLGLVRIRNNRGQLMIPMIILDSPSSTTSLTYSVRFASRNGARCQIQNDDTTGVITVMEIAG